MYRGKWNLLENLTNLTGSLPFTVTGNKLESETGRKCLIFEIRGIPFHLAEAVKHQVPSRDPYAHVIVCYVIQSGVS